MKTTVTAEIGRHKIEIETGVMAKQADGSVMVKCGSNMVLVTAVSSRRESTMDFFPLTVEFQEKFYSTGRIPGGYFKREGRPTETATLTARLIDRPIRPLFPEGYRFDTQVAAMIMSSDGEFPVDVLASIGASAALHVSDIPFDGPTVSLRIGRINGELIANPSYAQIEDCDMDLTVAGTRKGIVMVEGESHFVSENDLLEALRFAHEKMGPIFDIQDELKEKAGKPKREFIPPQVDADIRQKAEDFLRDKITAALNIQQKMERYAAADKAKKEAIEALTAGLDNKDKIVETEKIVAATVDDLKYEIARAMILKDKRRIDGRDSKTVRPISTETAVLPRTHGSALFTRGETQVLSSITLGTGDDEQMIDALQGLQRKRFMLHYNFPPFSVGETGRFGGQSRREVGHGFLASRSLEPILPDEDKFPYTIRLVGEVLESNGSSSMGTVCSGMMSLLDAGVPVKDNVAGIAMGLIKEGDEFVVLTDILGDEDHLGDMDFKVAGTREGVTAFQMDIKIDSVSMEIMEQALQQAKEGRIHILSEMEKTISQPRGQISEYAPRIETMKIKPEKVREVIGAGGKVIKDIIAKTGVKIDIEDDGTINIASTDKESREAAVQMINDICAEAEVGKTYTGKIQKITDFGAFVEILPNTSGLLHISEIAHERIRNVSDVLKEGEDVDVKVLDVDRTGRIKLSRKALLERPPKD
jgi:polyribonucleotide nucleotidyltransferase